MLLPMALERWSQVTIYAKPSRYSIGLPHEGACHICKTLKKLLATTSNRYRQAEFMQMTWTLPKNRICEAEERFPKVAAHGSCSS